MQQSTGDHFHAAICPFHRRCCLSAVLAFPVAAHEVPDPSIRHNAYDGVVRLYGAGGPDTAFKKIAEAFARETGIKVKVTGGPEPTWPRKAQADADILWGTAEEDMAGLAHHPCRQGGFRRTS